MEDGSGDNATSPRNSPIENSESTQLVRFNGIVKLNRKNYKTWAFNIRLELEELDLWEVVATDNEFAEPKKRKAFRIIARSISEEIQLDILDITCPRILWQKLASRFQPMTRLRRLQASKSLYTAKMAIGEDME